MNKTTQSILLAAMLVASGFAAAQNPAAPATRAEVKAEAGTAERKLGTGEVAKPNTSGAMQGNTSGLTRAEVESKAGAADRKLGTGETAKPNMTGSMATQGNTSGKTRAEVKADADSEPRKLSTGEVAKSGMSSASSAERKRMRAERRAAAKTKRDAKMMPAPVSEKAP